MLIAPRDPHILQSISCNKIPKISQVLEWTLTTLMHVHIILLPWSEPPLFQDLQSSRAITRENHTRELGSQWDSYGTKERVATKQYKYSPSLIQQSSIAITQAWQERGRELQVRSQWDSHGTRERVATKHDKYSPSRVVFTSPIQLVKHRHS